MKKRSQIFIHIILLHGHSNRMESTIVVAKRLNGGWGGVGGRKVGENRRQARGEGQVLHADYR